MFRPIIEILKNSRPQFTDLFLYITNSCGILKLYGMVFLSAIVAIIGEVTLFLYFIILCHECLNISIMVANIDTFSKQRLKIRSFNSILRALLLVCLEQNTHTTGQ